MSWETLRPVLLDLCERDPSPLLRPDPRVPGERRMPMRVVLAPWAVSVAARLHDAFADEVVLTVGNFGYPDPVLMDLSGRPRDPRPGGGEPDGLEPGPVVVDPSVVLVELRREVTVRSGHDGIGELVIANRSPGVLEFHRPTATVADLDTGVTVGGMRFSVRRLVGRTPFRLASGRSGAVHFTFSTASLDPAMGYAVPPGDWAIRPVLPLLDGRRLRAPLLPITIT